MTTELTVLSYNTLFGGADGASRERAELQIKVINERRPDVFLMQEAKGFESNGSELLYDLERRIGMRGFLALAPHTGQNVAIFIRAPLRPVAFTIDSTHFHHASATLKVVVAGGQALTLMSAHLCPTGVAVRRREASYLAPLATPDAWTLLAGDFNSASPHDPEPGDFSELPAHHRARYIADDFAGVDRSVLRQLEFAGWTDIGAKLGGAGAPTVPAAGFAGTEFATMRCDYLLASRALAEHARRYEVICTPDTDAASDHYPIVATFALPT